MIIFPTILSAIESRIDNIVIESNIYYVFEGINQYTSDFLHLYLGIPNNKLQFIFYSQANDIIIY